MTLESPLLRQNAFLRKNKEYDEREVMRQNAAGRSADAKPVL